MYRRAALIAIATVLLVPAPGSAQMADRWCGEPTGANRRDATLAPKVKYVYAYPADKASRFAKVASSMQTDAKSISKNWSSATGGRKTVRWDMGTSCGSRYLDIEIVKLPRKASAYHPNSDAAIERIRADLRAAIDPAPGRRIYAVMADRVRTEPDPDPDDNAAVYGIANGAEDDQPGVANATNRGGMIAIAFGGTGPAFGDDSSAITGALMHELTHTFGAVQDSAPHSDRFGHVTDGRDLLGSGATRPCAETPPGGLDCNGDDYFNVAPAPGSYLATHWNTYDAVYLAPPDELTAPAAPPVAKLVARADGTSRVSLDATATTDADGIVTKYMWDIGADGSYETSTVTPTTTVDAASNGKYGVRAIDEDGLDATATWPPAAPIDLGLKSTKTSQALKDAQTKGVLARAKPNAAGKLTFTLYKGRKKLKSVRVNATAGKTASKRIKLSSSLRRKYLKKGSYEIRASLAPTDGGAAVAAKITVNLE